MPEAAIDALEDRLVTDLRSLTVRHPRLHFATSLGLEDMVITDVIARHRLPIALATLDTGRLHEQTYALLDAIPRRYAGLGIATVSPQAEPLQAWVAREGINGFYNSLEARKSCCTLRKIEPLKRALRDADAWITGLRREQSDTRQALSYSSTDPLTQLPKYNPLLEWRDFDVRSYLTRHEVPVNALHAQGFPSIGCAPCTRAIAPGEHPRAGRWWWEREAARAQGQAAQECGLHVDENGRLVRSRPAESATEHA